MVLYYILFVIASIAMLVAFALFALWIFADCQTSAFCLVLLLAVGCIGIASGFGANCIKEKNTTVETKVVDMVVTRVDAVEDEKFIIVVDEEHVLEITAEEYASLKEGDAVNVKITKTTVFGELNTKYTLHAN